MRVAVLGANGQIGAALCAELASRPNVQCVAVVRNGVAAAVVKALAGATIEIRLGSVANPDHARGLVGDCSVVVNCAYPSAGGVVVSRRANRDLFDGVRRAAPGAVFIHLSSVAVYGLAGARGDRLGPDSSYGRDKLWHERYLQARVPSDRLLIVRLGHVYGPNTPISRFVVDCHLDATFRLPVAEASPSNALSLRCCVAALADACFGQPGGVYDFVDQPNTTWRELFDFHAAACGVEPVKSMVTSTGPLVDHATIGHGIRSTMRSTIESLSLGTIAANDALRSAINTLLGAAPPQLEAMIRRSYRRRVVQRQLSALRTERQPSRAPAWLYFPPVSGPTLPTASDSDAASRDHQALAEWCRRILDPRWSWQEARAEAFCKF